MGWWGFHTSPRKTEASDYLGRLEKRCAEILPGTQLVGVEPRSVEAATGWSATNEIHARPEANPKAFRRQPGRWVQDRPREALALFPEWQALLAELAR